MRCTQGIRSYNLFSIERLAADVARLEDAAAAGPVPNLAQELAQPRQLCQLLLSGKVRCTVWAAGGGAMRVGPFLFLRPISISISFLAVRLRACMDGERREGAWDVRD